MSPLLQRVIAAALRMQDTATAAGDPRLRFSGEITVGNIVTALTVLVSALGLGYTWWRDITLREREYADRVRTAAASTLAKLERAREIMLHFFDVFSTCFVPASTMMVKGRPARGVTNYVWVRAEETAAECNKRLLDEEIELAYVDLYAYDDKIYQQFVDARAAQQRVWHRIYSEAKMMTQEDNHAFESGSRGLGTQLRLTCADLAQEFRDETDSVLGPLRKRLQSWIRATPREIVKRTVNLGSPPPPADEDAVLPGVSGRAVTAFARGARRADFPPDIRQRLDRPFSSVRAAFEQLEGPRGRLGLAVGRLAARPRSAARQARVLELLRPYHLDQRPAIVAATDQILELTGTARQGVGHAAHAGDLTRRLCGLNGFHGTCGGRRTDEYAQTRSGSDQVAPGPFPFSGLLSARPCGAQQPAPAQV